MPFCSIRIWIITEFNAWFESQTALWSDEIDVSAHAGRK